MKTFETSRGRVVAIDVPPAVCPICGNESSREDFGQHAAVWHAEQIGTLRGPVRTYPALLVEKDAGKLFVILLVSPSGQPKPLYLVEQFSPPWTWDPDVNAVDAS
jgi:hypothetical protein